jgi:hypothetical protein
LFKNWLIFEQAFEEKLASYFYKTIPCAFANFSSSTLRKGIQKSLIFEFPSSASAIYPERWCLSSRIFVLLGEYLHRNWDCCRRQEMLIPMAGRADTKGREGIPFQKSVIFEMGFEEISARILISLYCNSLPIFLPLH